MLLTLIGFRSVDAPGIKRPLQDPSNRGKVLCITSIGDLFRPLPLSGPLEARVATVFAFLFQIHQPLREPIGVATAVVPNHPLG